MLVVLTTLPDRKVALTLARDLVVKRLAACVSVGQDCQSIYRWKGKIEQAREVPLLIKTSRKVYSKLEKYLKAHHPYESPEIVALPVARGIRSYLNWVESSVSPRQHLAK